MLRVLVVDDSPTIRELLVAILTSDPGIAVVGTASDGAEAIDLAVSLGPDLITMDIRMPKVDGVTAIRQIMRDRPTPIVVLCADANDAELAITFNALKAGALDVVEKPSFASRREMDDFARAFLSTVKLMAEVKVVRQIASESGELAPTAPPDDRAPAGGAIDAVAICSSTGGPAALEYLVRHLPRAFPAPIAVVQHITEGFLVGLVEWLDRAAALDVRVARDGERAQPGTIYFAPEGRHLVFGPGRVLAHDDAPPVRSHKPSGEPLFVSVAEHFGARGMGVILTGMGEDGVDGLARIERAGGVTIAQDEETSVVFGMPRVAIERGAASEILPLDTIAERMVYWCRVGGRGEAIR